MCTNPLHIIVNNEPVTVKCGRCFTCKREKAQDWAIKLINENQYHKKSCFITLTFDNKILINGNKYGANCSFIYHIENSKKYFTNFIKRLRKKFNNEKLTYFRVAEYGEKTKRPHYHVILWGEDFKNDRKEVELSKSGHTMYESQILSNLWGCGRCVIEDINSNNIIYTAQYTLKKFKNNETEKRYKSKIAFSNRSKLSVKWVRRNYNNIIKGYLEDKEGKKYKVPESYKKNLKESEKETYKNAYLKYEQKIMELLENESEKERIQRQIKKEKILEMQKKLTNKKRDF